MILHYLKDHAIVHTHLVMTELLGSNNVMMAHELVHSLAAHLDCDNNDNKMGKTSRAQQARTGTTTIIPIVFVAESFHNYASLPNIVPKRNPGSQESPRLRLV